MARVFFLSNPTLIITDGISYCVGSGFGTQLEPMANGQPNPSGPYPPFPSSGGGTVTPAMVAGNLAVSTTGFVNAALAAFVAGVPPAGGSMTPATIGPDTIAGLWQTFGGTVGTRGFNLAIQSTGAAPTQSFITSWSCVGNTVTLNFNGATATSFTQSGPDGSGRFWGIWHWFDNIASQFTPGNTYNPSIVFT